MPGTFGSSSRRVLRTDTHTVSGGGSMSNGQSETGRGPVGSLGATGPGQSATCSVGVTADSCAALFYTNGPNSNPSGPETVVYAVVQVGSATAKLDFAGTYATVPTLQPTHGRGYTGDDISFTYSFSVPSELVVYTYGEEDVEVPDDAYPSYGGVRIVGEYPSNFAVLVWEPVEGSSTTGTVTMADRSATASAPSESARFSDEVFVSALVAHNAFADTSNTPAGTIRANVAYSGYPVRSDGLGVTYLGVPGSDYEGKPIARAETGAGYASVTVETGSQGVPSPEYGGVSVAGVIKPTREATMVLDAYAMDRPHPHAVEWRYVRRYLGVIPTAPGEEYGTVVDPPTPILETAVGQSVSIDVEQRYEALGTAIQNKASGPKVRDAGAMPAKGVDRNDRPVQYDHYRNDVGRVMAWCVPPPGEDPSDWRVMLRGLAYDAMTLTHAATTAVPLGGGSSDGEDTIHPLSSEMSAEGYRYLQVEGDASEIRINGKRYPGSGLVDLCFPRDGVVSIDRQDTRYPLDEAHRSTVETPNWGITRLASVRAVGGTLSSLTLKRETGAKVHALAPFVLWVKEVPPDQLTTSGGDSYTVEHYLVRGIMGDVDGRFSIELPHVRRTDNHAPNRLWVSDYAHLPVSTIAGLASEIPGWSASVVGDDSPVFFLASGWIRSGGSWLRTWDRGAGTLKGQDLYDGIDLVGGVGDVFGAGGGGNGVILYGRKVFRGSALGPLKADATVTYADLDGSHQATQASAGRRYHVGPTLSDPNYWGLAWTDPAHKASFGSVPRLVEWGAFDVVRRQGDHVAYDVSPNLRHYRAHADGTLVVRSTTNVLPDEGREETSPTEAAWLRVRAERSGHTGWLHALYGDGATVFLARSVDEGASYQDPMTIGTGDYGDLEQGDNGVWWIYWVDAGTVRYKLLDRERDEIGGGATNVADAADAPIAVRASVGSRGEWRMGLYYRSASGDRIFVTAPDGKTFG